MQTVEALVIIYIPAACYFPPCRDVRCCFVAVMGITATKQGLIFDITGALHLVVLRNTKPVVITGTLHLVVLRNSCT
jgi:hypothetical protein